MSKKPKPQSELFPDKKIPIHRILTREEAKPYIDKIKKYLKNWETRK